MENEVLKIDIQKIQVVPGLIVFNEYETLKQQAMQLAYNIEQVEVNEENVQVSKKMLAAVNKRVKEMEDRRISIKKELLEPYNMFESQVKDIVNIVKNAESIVRDQLREIEENEREQKKAAISEIFEKRIKHYDFNGMFGFDDFIKPQHLNKSVTMKAVESEMVEWLQKKEVDLNVIKSLPDSEHVLAEYLDTKDISIAIQIVNDRKRVHEVVSEAMNKERETAYVITLSDEKDFKLMEMFMLANDIKYKFEKVVK